MPLRIHNITQDEHQENDQTIRILRGGFYLPFFREGASIGVQVEEFPDDPEPVLLAAIYREMQAKPELKDMIRNAITEEHAYLVGQIRHHDEQKAVCLDRLKELEGAFMTPDDRKQAVIKEVAELFPQVQESDTQRPHWLSSIFKK